MPRNKGLGRGLDAIYIDNALPEEETKDAPKTVPISEIDLCADQPRKVFDPESLAAAIQEVLREKERYCEGAKRRYLQHFTKEQMIQKTINLYESYTYD